MSAEDLTTSIITDSGKLINYSKSDELFEGIGLK